MTATAALITVQATLQGVNGLSNITRSIWRIKEYHMQNGCQVRTSNNDMDVENFTQIFNKQ